MDAKNRMNPINIPEKIVSDINNSTMYLRMLFFLLNTRFKEITEYMIT